MDDPTAVAEVLERAADVIERDGWCRNEITTPDGRVCLVGAIERAAFGRDYESGPVTDQEWDLRCGAVSAANRAITGCDSMSAAARWNDNEAKDQYDVIDLLRHTAKDIRNGEAQ